MQAVDAKLDQSADPAVIEAFKSLPADFDGFAEIFETRIRPPLQAREADRVAAAKKAVQGRWIGGAVGIAIGAVSVFVFQIPQLLILAVIVGVGIVAFMGSDLQAIGKETKTLMVMPVAKQFGLSFVEAPGHQASMHRFHREKLVPHWDRETYQDHLAGQRGSVTFEFFEAHLKERRTSTDSKGRTKTRWVTVFRGQCLRFDFHKTFYGRTLIARDAGFFDRFGGGKGMDQAKLEDPVFEKIFSVFTTDQDESRYLLTPDIMQRLVDLETAFHGNKIRCAFAEGEILICMEGGDLFEPGSLHVPLDDPSRISRLLNDFAAVFHLIDAASP